MKCNIDERPVKNKHEAQSIQCSLIRGSEICTADLGWSENERWSVREEKEKRKANSICYAIGAEVVDQRRLVIDFIHWHTD